MSLAWAVTLAAAFVVICVGVSLLVLALFGRPSGRGAGIRGTRSVTTPPRLIGLSATIFATIAAITGLGVGAYAALKTENGAGAASAFAVGIFAAIVAMTGRVPRVKIGDTEVDLAYAAGAADTAADIAAEASEKAERSSDPKEVAEAIGDSANRYQDLLDLLIISKAEHDHIPPVSLTYLLSGGRDDGRPAHRPTLLDVARRAGVSVQTASRVLHGRSRHESPAAARVRAAAAELSYPIPDEAPPSADPPAAD